MKKIMKNSKIYILGIGITLFFLFIPLFVQAETLVGDTARSTEKLGDFIAEFTYNLFTPSAAELNILFKNTSPQANGGFLTGFVFNNPNNFITNVSMTSSNPFFSLLGGPSFKDTISASPFGKFDIGAAVGGDFLGGGKPSFGIPVGGSASFKFSFEGTNLDKIDTSSFIQAKSSEGEFMIARFRGFNDGGSDKVPANVIKVPEPEIVFLLGFGLLGLALCKRKSINSLVPKKG
ncbi:MAG: PEP-CTERM sorting domain-containing protein [Syntrophorhabdaceae bacterium]|nr:PEP-CTERM sorting domain-containing protein [Syntrophorhabdaceae bacterium]